MADIAMGAAGAVVGSFFGNPMLGFSIGMTLGNMFFGPKQSFDSGRLQDLKIGTASQAAPIPIVFGTVRTAGNIIWAPALHESSSSGGAGGSLGGPTFNNYSYTADLAIMICEGEITRINKIWADSELIYDYNGGTPIWAEFMDSAKVDMYLGTMVQTVNDVISAERVAAGDLAPAYLGRAYVVFEGFNWSRFGHTPNFNFEVVRGAAVTLDEPCAELLERVGIDAAEIDMTALAGVAVDGWMIPARTDLLGALAMLIRAYNADLVEVDGKIKGVLRNVAASFALDDKWLGCATDGEPPTTKVETTRVQELELSRSVDVTYRSKAHDHQQFTQRSLRRVVESQGEETFDLPLVLTETAARRFGETALHEEWIRRNRYRTSWPLIYLSIAPGDVGMVPVGGQTITVRVEEQLAGMLGHIESRMVAHDNSVYTQYVDGAEPPDAEEVTENGDFTIWVRDLNALRDIDADYPMLYGAAARNQSGWPGFIIESEIPMYSALGGATDLPFNCDRKAVLGETDSVLASGTPGLWDRTNTVDVTLVQGTLSSATEAEVLNGANLCVIGDEILQFATATLIGTNQYRLSVLLRGRRGTENYVGVHGTGEPFVLFDANAIESFAFQYSMRDGESDFFMQTNGLLGPTVSSNIVTEVLACKSRWPYSPMDVRGERDGSNNLTITWKRRSRKAAPGVLAIPALDETSELYEIDVMNGAVVVRTITATTATASYTALQQTGDFGSTQSSLTVRVYQVSPGWIRGHKREATI